MGGRKFGKDSSSLLNSLSTISSLSLGTEFPLLSCKGHFCDLLSSMFTCLLSTVMGFPSLVHHGPGR